MGYSPWGHKESDTTEVTEYICIQCVRTTETQRRGFLPIKTSCRVTVQSPPVLAPTCLHSVPIVGIFYTHVNCSTGRASPGL